jgi:tRNA threonylcarbamoyl adenosine modification protein (Sua5/YciO/YrdC/YwlC family)
MAQLFRIHPSNPQPRLVNQAAAILRGGAVIVYPTDSCYALGCELGNKAAQDRIRRIRRLDEEHNFTLVCRDLSEIATYARVDNSCYRLLRKLTPGPYTFILPASREVPRRLQNPKRRTVGIRVPDHRVVQALLDALGEPIMSSTLLLPGESIPLADPDDIVARLGHQVDVVIDGEGCGVEPTTVIDLVDGEPIIRRRGRGDTTGLEG